MRNQLNDRFLRLKAIAAATDTSLTTLHRWRKEGRITFTKVTPRTVGMWESELREFIAQRKAGGDSE